MVLMGCRLTVVVCVCRLGGRVSASRGGYLCRLGGACVCVQGRGAKRNLFSADIIVLRMFFIQSVYYIIIN